MELDAGENGATNANWRAVLKGANRRRQHAGDTPCPHWASSTTITKQALTRHQKTNLRLNKRLLQGGSPITQTQVRRRSLSSHEQIETGLPQTNEYGAGSTARLAQGEHHTTARLETPT